MFITFTSRTNYKAQNSPAARLYEVRQVIEVSDADAANLKAMGLARDASRQEISDLKSAAKDGQEFVVAAPPKDEKAKTPAQASL